MADKVIYWSKTALTGGAAGALDSIDGTALQDGEVAHVWISNVLYIYLLDVDSGAAESSPAIIAPDTNAGNKRWILQGVRTINVGSDADGDMYYRASGALARLEKGTALYMLRANSAGTAPEWALNNSILGPVAYGNTLRSTRILIENGGDAAHIKCTSTAWFNGDTNVAQDNIGKDAIDTGVWNLDATGAILKLLNTGIVGNIVNSLACQISMNYSGTALCVYPTVASGLSMNFTNATTGATVDLTTLVDTGPIYVLAAYITV